MSRSVAPVEIAGQELYVLENAGTTQLDDLFGNFSVLATILQNVPEGVPAGAPNQVQYNNNGALAGAAGLNYSATTLSLAEGQTSATGYCSHAEGLANAGAIQTGEHAEGVALNGLQAGRSHLTLQVDNTVSYTYTNGIATLGELKIGGVGGQRISIPAGWTYSFEFNIQAVDASFNVSRWQGWATVQNTGNVVAGTLDGLRSLSTGTTIGTTYWAQDGAITTNPAISMAPTGPGTELPQLFLVFDTDSLTGEVIIRVGGVDEYLSPAWYGIVTINKVKQGALPGSATPGGTITRDAAVYEVTVTGNGAGWPAKISFTPTPYTFNNSTVYQSVNVSGLMLFNANAGYWRVESFNNAPNPNVIGNLGNMYYVSAATSARTPYIGTFNSTSAGYGWPNATLALVTP